MIASFFPVYAGRVSDTLVRNRSLYQVQSDQSTLLRLQTQLSTGHRFQNISEAPNAAVRVMGLQRAQEFKEQTLVNLKSAKGYLNVTETSLSNIQDILNEVKGLSVEAASNVISETDREGFKSQIDSYLTRLANLSNQRSQDRYLFTGGNVAQQPIELRNSFARFHGDDLDLLAIGDQNSYIAHNVTSQRALGVVSTGVTGTADLSPSLTLDVRLTDLNGGQGVNPGAVEFSNGTSSVIVDFAKAESVRDVLDGINSVSLDGRAIQATIGTNGLVINYADALTGTLRIKDSGSGRAAKNLGIATNVASPPLPNAGSDLNPIIRNTTLLSQLNDGAGLDVTGGFRIIQGGQAFTIDLSGATTVDDALIAINNSGASVIADIAKGGRSLRIRSTESGSDFSITENLGTLATDLGLRTLNGQVLLSSLNHGLGLELTNGPDLTFTRSDGTEFSVDLNSAVTVQDVIDLVNNSVDNQDPNLRITLEEQPFSNSLTLRATVPTPPIPPAPPPVPISVRSSGGSAAAVGLGLAPIGATSATATIVGTDYYIEGRDPNPQETQGIFNTLIRLRDAIEKGDIGATTRAAQLIDKDLDRLSLTRGDLGIRQQRIDTLINSSEDTITELKGQESDARDVDIASVISELTSRQAAYESNLKLLSQNIRRTIFDFI